LMTASTRAHVTNLMQHPGVTTLPDGGPTHAVYNIVLEPMVIGGWIPEMAVPVAGAFV
jgi:hypothetical protein